MFPDACLESGPASRAFGTGRLLPALLVLAAVLLTAPGAFAGTPLCEARAVRTHQVLLAPSMADWEPVSDRAVVIWTRNSPRASLVTLAGPLRGLTSAAMITLVDGDADRMISPCGRDSLELGRGESTAVRIVSIQRLSASQTAALDRADDIQAPVLSRV